MSNNSVENHITPNYSKKEILQELDRILSSKPFSKSAVLTKFLKFIVEETLEGHTQNLKEYTIAVSALGKSIDFDPQSNATIRINAGRLRRLLYTYYAGPGIIDPIKIEVVKGTYVPMFRSHVVKPKTEITGKSIPMVHTKPVTFSRSKLTLAILPFRNLLPDNEYQFFVDGFGEELTRIFATSEDIAVVAHFSTLKYATHIDDIRIIGADLGVHYVIVGSVKRSATKIRVNVGLVETMNGMQIWTKDYSHDLEIDKTMHIQDQINEDVFAVLSGHFGFIVTDAMRLMKNDLKQDLQTFDAILWYHHSQITNSEEDYTQSRKGLEKIIQEDPDNAMCLVILADTYVCCYSLGYTTVENPISKAFKLITKALHITPLSQYAHIIHGWINIYLGKKKEALEALEYSVKLAPPSLTYNGAIGFAFACAGEYKRGQIILQELLALNPYCPWWYYLGLFFSYYHSKNYKDALTCTRKMSASDDVYLIPLLRSAVKGQLNMIPDAKLEVDLLHENFPEILSNLKIYLSSFILDDALIDTIILGARKAGVNIA